MGLGGGALGAAAAGTGVALFAATRLVGGAPSLGELAETSLPLATAVSNGRPSVVEFYADWCEVCQETAPDVAAVRGSLGDSVNYVMLNIDNPKWAPELSEYGVDGIPHFVFLDGSGQEQGSAVGEVPLEVLQADADALKAGEKIPYTRATSRQAQMRVSSRGEEVLPPGPGGRDPRPRDHS